MSGERWGPPPKRRKRPAAANPRRFQITNSNDDGAQSIPSGPFVKPFDGSAATAVGFGGKHARPRVKILRFTPYQNATGTQLGCGDIETGAGMQIRGLKLIAAGTRWVGSPGKWRKGPDGEFVLGNKGKRIFDPTVDFKDRATREKFLDLVPADTPTAGSAAASGSKTTCRQLSQLQAWQIRKASAGGTT
jgi:hypothetical protein